MQLLQQGFVGRSLSLEDLKSRADRSESSEARILPLAEKMDRIGQQKNRLTGISFTPQSEPSHSLIDKVCQQLEDNVVTYIELNRCSSRHDEALHAKMDTALALDQSGGLRLSKKQKVDDVNVTGEHRLRQAFLRRSLAYDLSGIATFAVLDLWTQKLFEKMNEAPVAHYRHISVEQVINADKALWVKVSNETRGKLQPKTGAEKPFDVAFTKFSEHAEVLQHLSPLQGPGGYVHDRARTASAPGKGKGSTIRTAKGRHHKEKGKPHQALPCQMTARSLLMESSFASDGKLVDAQPKSSLGSDAWSDITCVGRRHVTSYTRAMNAHTDFSSTQSTTVSLWMPRHLKFAVAQLACQTH